MQLWNLEIRNPRLKTLSHAQDSNQLPTLSQAVGNSDLENGNEFGDWNLGKNKNLIDGLTRTDYQNRPNRVLEPELIKKRIFFIKSEISFGCTMVDSSTATLK